MTTPKSQPAVEQPLTGGCWHPPRKDTPHPRTKEKQQRDGRRGAIMIKSNSIPIGWVTHKLENNNIKEVLTVMKVLAPTLDFPTWEASKGTGNPLEIWLWRTAGFDYRTSTGQGETETLGGHQQNLVCTMNQGKGDWVRSACECLRVYCGVAYHGDRHWQHFGIGPFEVTSIPTIQPVDSQTGLPHVKQITGMGCLRPNN